MVAAKLGAVAQLGIAALVVLVVAQVPALGVEAALVTGAVLAGGAWAILRWSHRHVGAGSSQRLPDLVVGPLVLCWTVLAIYPPHAFRRVVISEGDPAPRMENILKILIFVVVAAVAVHVIRRFEPSLVRARPPLPLLLLPAWGMLSSLWSATPGLALVRGGQMAVVGLVAWATLAAGRAEPAAARRIVTAVLRWVLWVTLALVAYGQVAGPVPIWSVDAASDRFTWPFAHPLTSAFIMSVAIVIAAVTPREHLRLPGWGRAGAVAVLGLALIANNSRQTLGAIAVTGLLGLLVAPSTRAWARRIALPVVGAVAAAGLLFFEDSVREYVLRTQDSSSLATANGRLQLWGMALDAMRTPFDLVFGFGLGITRTLWISELPWAYSAHNSVLAALVSTGLVGVGLLLLQLGHVLAAVTRSRPWGRAPDATMALLMVPVLVKGLGADSLAGASPALVVLYLAGTLALVRNEHTRARPAESTPVATAAGP